MKKRALLISLVFILILSGCNLTNSTDTKVGRGVVLEITDILGPDNERTLGEAEGLRADLQITNYQPFEIKGFLCIDDGSILSGSYGGIPDKECVSVKIPPTIGDQESSKEFSFPQTEKAYYYQNLFEEGEGMNMQTSLIATFKYQAITNASMDLCLPLTNDDTYCSKKETITSINQGEMPLEISSVEKRIYPSIQGDATLSLRINIEKVEEGMVLNYEDLVGDTRSEPKAYFEIEALNLKFKCKGVAPSGEIKLDPMKDSTEILCEAQVRQKQEFIKDKLYISLYYGFKKFANSDPIKIKKREVI